MSLLMDALRKAEEAKRQAAQKQQEDKQQEAPTNEPLSPAVENLHALEEPFEYGGEVDFDLDMPEEHVLNANPDEATSDEHAFDFDFEIDENFGLDDKITDTEESNTKTEVPSDEHESTSAEVVELEENSNPDEQASPYQESEYNEDEVDYLEPEELSRFTTAEKTSNQYSSAMAALSDAKAVDRDSETLQAEPESRSQITTKASSLGLTLEDRAPDIERPSIIGGEMEVSADASTGQQIASDLEAEEASPEPIRASRNDDQHSDVAKQPLSSEQGAKLAKTSSPKFAEESRKRETARAVFSAKHKSKALSPRKKRIAIAAAIALFPLTIGGYLFLDAMGIFSSASQFSATPLYSDDVETYADPLENVVEQESALPDLSPELITLEELELTNFDSSIAEIEIEIVPVPVPVPEVAVINALPVLAEQVTSVIDTPVETLPSIASTAEAPEPAPVVEDLPVVAETPAPIAAPAPISITRTDNIERVDPQLTQAYANYRTSDYIGARARYQQVLRDKPNNRDAMLGLAAVAMQLGDAANARETYIKLLELDPRDVHARVGLLETMPASDPVMLESELRTLFAAHPEVAQLAFALGNHFASQRRWSDAQQSYYDALLAAKSGGNGAISPDYAFNLAVSLERLNQPQPAYTFYREALEQSEVVTPGFDIRVLRERLNALERILP